MLPQTHMLCMPRYSRIQYWESNIPVQNFVASAVTLAKGLAMGAAFQCPLMALSGLIPCLLLGLEPVLSSPCVMFSMKVM